MVNKPMGVAVESISITAERDHHRGTITTFPRLYTNSTMGRVPFWIVTRVDCLHYLCVVHRQTCMLMTVIDTRWQCLADVSHNIPYRKEQGPQDSSQS